MASSNKLTNSISWLIGQLKKVSGVDVLFGDPDPGVSSFPLIIMTPEDSGEVLKLANDNYNCIIPFRLYIRADKKKTLDAYRILEKVLEGADQLRPERGYTIGIDPESGGLTRGDAVPRYDEDGFFELGLNFKINEIIQ